MITDKTEWPENQNSPRFVVSTVNTLNNGWSNYIWFQFILTKWEIKLPYSVQEVNKATPVKKCGTIKYVNIAPNVQCVR